MISAAERPDPTDSQLPTLATSRPATCSTSRTRASRGGSARWRRPRG